MPLSPRTQAMMQGPANPREAFEAGFQELALTQLVSTLPEIANEVAALKVIDASPETSSATGTFIIVRGDDEIHVPVVLADNELMPFDVMYVKSLDMMLPLTQEWLSTLDEMDVASMGQAVVPPKTLRTDEDIRNLVIPPTTGRYSYASDASARLLPLYLKHASNSVKKSFLETLRRHLPLAKQAFEIYGEDVLRESVRPHAEKTASATQHAHFMTIETPVSEIKEVFGDKAPEAMRDIALKGYSTRDDRDQVDEVVDVERPLNMEVPGAPGFYRVYDSMGGVRKAMIFTNVKSLKQLQAQKNLAVKSLDNHTLYGDPHTHTPRMGVTGDGSLFITGRDFLAEVLADEEVPKNLREYVTKARPGTPRNGQRGFFFDPDRKGMDATEPFKIESVTNVGNSRRIKCKPYGCHETVMLHQIEGSSVTQPRAFSTRVDLKGNRLYDEVPRSFLTATEKTRSGDDWGVDLVVLIPWHWRFVPINDVLEPKSLLADPSAVKSLFHDALTLSGAERIAVKKAGAGLLWMDGESLTPVQCVEKIAHGYNVSVPDAEGVVKLASERGGTTVYAVNRDAMRVLRRRLKVAQEGGDMMAPPEALPPEAVAPPQPPLPSPVEIAAQEVAEQLIQAQQNVQQELISQQDSLQTQLQAVQAVMQRASQISAELGMPPGGEAMDPMMGGGMPPGGEAMDPMMGGGMPPGAMDPTPIEEPMMMELAANLMDPDLFDAAAVAQMASHNDYDATIQQFVPSLRQALDSLGRLLVEFRMRGAELKTSIGEEAYGSTRDRLELLFEELGTALIDLSGLSAQEPAVRS